jgi:hypothetical protein
MKYIKVFWRHTHPDEPTLLYSELDDARWETRKVEIFRNGKIGYASRTASGGSTGLGIIPVPQLSTIASDPEFEPAEITQEEFEGVWRRVTRDHLCD